MVEEILQVAPLIFGQCAAWTQQLLDAVGGTGVVLAAFCICLSIGLLFMPMRGRMSAVSFVSDYQSHQRGKAISAARDAKTAYYKSHTKKGG